jgi:hypothetical protein
MMPAVADFPDAIADLIETGRDFHRRGWSPGTGSNYSVVVGRDPLTLFLAHGDRPARSSRLAGRKGGSRRASPRFSNRPLANLNNRAENLTIPHPVHPLGSSTYFPSIMENARNFHGTGKESFCSGP